MPHMIESAKSGRASCRSCKQTIAKGDLRFGEEVPNQFAAGEMTYSWHHLPCAAQKKPSALKLALDTTDVDIPDKPSLLETIENNAKNEKPSTYPFADHAPTSRASCLACGEKLEKGSLRVAVEEEMDAGAFMRKQAKYLHPGCAVEHTGEDFDELMEKLTANSINLKSSELEVLREQMQAAD